MSHTSTATSETPFMLLPKAVRDIIACPQCGGTLVSMSAGPLCQQCETAFVHTADRNVDLRLRRPKTYQVEYQVGRELLKPGFEFAPIQSKPDPATDFSQTQLPWHLSRELLSYFPKARSNRSVALDLGCGTGLHREVCERAGFVWAGLDYRNPMAPILGDGHALPFRYASVEFVVSLAVLEHIRYPSVVAQEVMRILQPGGYYIGTVSFLEPFHGDSYYHHTHLGTYNTLMSAGFEVVCVGPTPQWSGLRAQAKMSLFPRMPERMVSALVWPLDTLHRLWWWAGRRFSHRANEPLRQLSNAGSFEFVARKPI